MHRFHTLPDSFYSDETGEPFDSCCDCGARLPDCPDGHIIQKAYAKGETIMEIAICVKCHVGLLSEASRDTYDRWMDRVNPPAPSTADDAPRVRVFI